MTHALRTYKENVDAIKQRLYDAEPQISKAIPQFLRGSMDAERIARTALTSVLMSAGESGNARKLFEVACRNPDTLAFAVIALAQLGLVTGPTNQAHLVPFGNKISVMVGYGGWNTLASRAENVRNISGHVVWQREVDEGRFHYREFPEELEHNPFLDTPEGGLGKLHSAYAVVHFTDGSTMIKWMSGDQIRAIKAKAKTDKFWGNPQIEPSMWRKTPMRAVVKDLPASGEKEVAMQFAMNLDEAFDDGRDQHLGHIADVIEADQVGDGEKATDKQIRYLQSLRSQLVKKLGVPLERLCVHLRAVMDDDTLYWPWNAVTDPDSARGTENSWLAAHLSKAQAGDLIDLLEEEKGGAAEDAEVG